MPAEPPEPPLPQEWWGEGVGSGGSPSPNVHVLAAVPQAQSCLAVSVSAPMTPREQAGALVARMNVPETPG